jgi:type III secretion protein U
MSAEERELPASAQKLRKSREKGQVAKSKDLSIAVALIVGAGYLIARMGSLLGQLAQIWNRPIDFHDGKLAGEIAETASDLLTAGAYFVGPLFVAMILGGILADLMMKQGFIFSLDPILPKLDRIDPIQGFTALFKLNKLIDLVKAVVKLAILGAGGVLALSGFLNQLMWVPLCGIACASAVWVQMVKLLSGLTIMVFALNGLIDMRLQSWLFLRDQRMTKTERKQESKNQNQSPEVRNAIRQQARANRGERKGGVSQASLMIGDATVVIGIRFVRDETPAPLCVCKARGAAAKRMVDEATKLDIPIHTDWAYAELLYKDVKTMNFMPASSFTALAQIFKDYKLV